jgi:hypothetical protein
MTLLFNVALQYNIEGVEEDGMLFAISGTYCLLMMLILWAKALIAQTVDAVMADCWVSMSRHYGGTDLHYTV